MLHKSFTLSTENIGKETAYCSVGFVAVSVSGSVEEATCAGSGTLVTVGSLHGVLTAAHVVDALPKTGEVGLVVGIEDPSKYQRQVSKMKHTESILLCSKPFDQYGPDLAFLTLPPETIGWLKAQRSFHNLVKHRAGLHPVRLTPA